MLEAETARLVQESQAERRLREEAEVKATRERAEAEEEWNRILREKERQVNAALQEQSALRAEIDGLRTSDERKTEQINQMAAQIASAQQRQRAFLMALGVLTGVGLWFFNDIISQIIVSKWGWLAPYTARVGGMIGTSGSLIFTLSAIPYIKSLPWRPELKMALLTGIVAVAIGFSRILDAATWSAWSAYVTVATAIAAILVFGIYRRAP